MILDLSIVTVATIMILKRYYASRAFSLGRLRTDSFGSDTPGSPCYVPSSGGLLVPLQVCASQGTVSVVSRSSLSCGPSTLFRIILESSYWQPLGQKCRIAEPCPHSDTFQQSNESPY